MPSMPLARGTVVSSPVDSYYDNLHAGGSSSQPLLQDPSSSSSSSSSSPSSSQRLFGLMGHNNLGGEGGEPEHLPAMSDPSSSSSGGGGGCLFFNPPSSAVDSHHSVLNLINTSSNTFLVGSSMLSFDQGHHLMEEYGLFDSNAQSATHHPNSLKNGTDPLLAGGWVYPEKETGDELQERKLLDGAARKRPHMGGDVQPSKKQSSNKKVKNKAMPTKDPQSIAAKNRRERISERLKILQDLVPNGTKVDLVTTLEKAISYVKFLQLQVKVLATDEFWPSHGGKAPNISQVKEAIDAIITSQRNPSSK